MTPRGGQFGLSWLAAKARRGVLFSNSPRLIAFEDCKGNKNVHRQSLGIPPQFRSPFVCKCRKASMACLGTAGSRAVMMALMMAAKTMVEMMSWARCSMTAPCVSIARPKSLWRGCDAKAHSVRIQFVSDVSTSGGSHVRNVQPTASIVYKCLCVDAMCAM